MASSGYVSNLFIIQFVKEWVFQRNLFSNQNCFNKALVAKLLSFTLKIDFIYLYFILQTINTNAIFRF